MSMVLLIGCFHLSLAFQMDGGAVVAVVVFVVVVVVVVG